MSIDQNRTQTTRYRRKVLFLVWLSTLLFMSPCPAHAHKVSVFAWLEGDTIYTRTKFFGGKEVKKGMVEVFDVAGNRLLQGQTNDNGEFSFKAPQKTELKIVVSAGMGHRGEWTVKKTDFDENPASPSMDAPAASSPTEEITPAATVDSSATPGVISAMNADEIRTIVEKALDKKLAPVIRMVSESNAGTPNVADILGGIGYIIGLVGLAAYVGNRKKKDHLAK